MPRMNSTKGFDQLSGQGAGNSANYIQRKNLKLQKLINQANATPMLSTKKSAHDPYEDVKNTNQSSQYGKFQTL